MCWHRSNPGVVQWWGTLQKTHPQHWLTTLLAARLTPATAESDTSSVVTLLPVTCQIETNPPPVGAEQRQAQLEATCANLLTFPDVSFMLAVSCLNLIELDEEIIHVMRQSTPLE